MLLSCSRAVRRAGTVLAVLATTATAWAGPAAGAVGRPTPPPADAPVRAQAAASLDLVAVAGTDRRLYVKISDEAGWTDLGGKLVSAPVFTITDDDEYFVAVSTDGNLWVRGFEAEEDWRPLGPVGTKCLDVSIAASDDTLAVACTGTNSRLYVGKAPLVAGQLPRVASWAYKGGRILHGGVTGYAPDPDPRVEGEPGEFYYQVVGTDHRVYERTDADGWSVPDPNPALRCYGPLSHDLLSEAGAACRASDGGLLVLTDVSASGATTYAKIRGTMVGRPGVTFDDDLTSRYYVLGTNGRVYRATVSSTGVVGGFTRYTGSGLHGLAAAGLGTPGG